ncbi:Uncharacterized protein FKW44_012886 [Caligus rogercresseyi]|uniref:Uncharacterized protein n=1 Tax=Caligus rogercresseyi TaxID=217165 RepID=A0A7T8HKB8_CALRO|nr:Uncharacterized protein FKW44_012886 [Caligus rogercresseyi]
MIFVAIINGMVPIVHAFLEDDGQLSSVNSDSYLRLLQDIIWPRLCHSATRSLLWWMQDGAPPYCTNAALKFLMKSFEADSSAEGRKIPGQLTVQISTLWTSTSGLQHKLEFIRKNQIP